MTLKMEPKELTYDQKKAAEAAFRGLPPNPKWSAAARAIYDGIVGVMAAHPDSALATSVEAGPMFDLDEIGAEDGDLAEEHETMDRPVAHIGAAPGEQEEPDEDGAETTSLVLAGPPVLNRDEAIQAGILIDVTAVAHEIGLRLPVGISKPLWEIGITASHQVEDEDYERRVRDVLMALRLHLETSEITSPWIKFPALLSFPPDTAPQVCSLYAVAHKDPSTPYSITLLLPHELSSIK